MNLTLYNGYAYFIVRLKNNDITEEDFELDSNPSGIYLEYTKTGKCAEFISGNYFLKYGKTSQYWFDGPCWLAGIELSSFKGYTTEWFIRLKI